MGFSHACQVPTATPGVFLPCVFRTPTYSILTNQATTDAVTPFNRPGPPSLTASYFNGAQHSLLCPEATTIGVAPALDEGGNFIDVRYGPISLTSPTTGAPFLDAHLACGSAAINTGDATLASTLDIDGQVRLAPIDIGADERLASCP